MACNCGKKRSTVVSKRSEKTISNSSSSKVKVAAPMRRVIKKRMR